MKKIQMFQNHKSLFSPIKLFGFVEIYISTVFLIFFALIFDFANTLLVTYIIVIIHEMAHVAAAVFFKVELEKIEILPFGVTMKIKSNNIKYPSHEAKIAIAGPLSNIVMGVLSLALYRYKIINYDFACFLVTANCGIALINIIPALPLDGGRIMKAMLIQKWGYVRAFNFTMIVTKIFIFIIVVGGIYIMILSNFNFSVLLIGAFLIANAISEQRGSKMTMMREILYSRQKLEQAGAERVGVIALMYNQPARKVLKMLSYNKYYIINIISDDMRIIGSITETELIEGIIQKGIRIKAINFIK